MIIQIENMTDMELIEDRLEHINNAIDLILFAAEKMFQARDKDEPTTELKLLTDIGFRTAAMKICCDRIKAQIEVLKDLESEVKDD